MNHEAAQTALHICTQWRKSSYSFPEGVEVECVEITTEVTGWVGIRDSKLGADSPVLACTTTQWQTMLGQTMLADARVGQLKV